MYPLRATKGKSVKKKEKSAGRFFSEQNERIKEYKGWQISDPEKYPKEFYFRDIMHVIPG